MQLLNSNIPQGAQTTRYSNKKSTRHTKSCAFFCFVAFSYYKDGGSEGIRSATFRLLLVLNFILFLRSFFVTMSLSRRGGKQPFHRLFGRLAFVVVYGIVCKPTSNPFESPSGDVKTKRTGKFLPVRFVWRKRGDSNP